MVDRQSVTPGNPWVAQLARIQGIQQELPSVATYDLVLEDPTVAEAFKFQPGQFNMLYLPGFGEAAISISSDPSHLASLQHTVRVAGNVTTALSRLHVGDQLGVRGPFGSYWPLEACRGKDVVIACGGIGLPPLRPLIYYMIQHREEFGRVHLLYGARTPGELLFTDEFPPWQAAGIEMAVTVDLGYDDWTGDIGVVPVLFHRLNLNAHKTIVMTCGPEVMMRFVIFEALARGIDPRNIYLSMERNMQCAVGLCGACQLGPKFVCKDGPVFTYEQMEPYLMLEDL
ncbi:MAG: Ni/Fe hydrogenase subunit gamma [Planctomycetaceae bacterium]|nr:Ni/Fe hydrogenase subunit gamma [Planctomycetaceae bacterium]